VTKKKEIRDIIRERKREKKGEFEER
jgi:hypothetical protein